MKDLLTKPTLTAAAMEEALTATVQQLHQVAQVGREMSDGITQVFMVSCGGGLHIKNGLQWWCDTFGSKIQYRTFSAADFLSLPLIEKVGPETLVILSSKSGSTKETLAVGARLKETGCKVACFTQSEASKLVQYGQKSFFTGDTPQSFHSMLMLMHAFVGGIWAEREGWGALDGLLASLAKLPTVLAQAALQSQTRGLQFAENFDKTGITYFIGSGPMQFVGEAFGNCLLEEMLELDINTFPANHFYHSLVEKLPLKEADRIILFLGLDQSRWQVEQVQKFCAANGVKAEVYDARDYEMGAIDSSIRALLAPIIVEAALKPMAEPLSAKTKDLDSRKYMGKVDFWKGCDVVAEVPGFIQLN